MFQLLRLCLVMVTMLLGVAGCREEPAKVVMPENPSPLPDPGQRFELGGEAAASKTETGLSK